MDKNVSKALTRKTSALEAELARRRVELAELRATLLARELALGEAHSRIVSFEGRYRSQVGVLLRQLDEWEQKVAEQRVLHNLSRPSVREAATEPEPEVLVEAEAAPLPDLRNLFRELAKRVHPDFATDDADAERRTRLMAQANEAFRRQDAGILQRMLGGFDPPEGLGGSSVGAELARTVRLIQQVQHDVATIEDEAEALAGSDIALLQQRCITAALEGRDLLAEMAGRVKGRIGMAMREYELDLTRIKNPPKGPRMEELLSAEVEELKPKPRFGPRRVR